MPEFRLTQISDTHLARRLPTLTDNFHRVSEYIDAKRPDLVINSGDIAFDGPTSRDDLEFARACMTRFRFPAATARQSRHRRQPDRARAGADAAGDRGAPAGLVEVFGEDRWRFEAAGWCFIGLNSLVMNSGLGNEAEQFDWLASELASVKGRPVALFLHKPLFLNSPDDPELAATSIRYVPQPARSRLLEMLRSVDLRLVASGHVHQRRDFTLATSGTSGRPRPVLSFRTSGRK